MLKKVLLASAACIALAGCATDKISMSSEVGGSGSTAAGFTSRSATGQDKSSSAVAGLVGGTLLGGIVDGLTGTSSDTGTSASSQPVQTLVSNVLDGLLGSGDSGGLLEIASIIPSGLAGENDSLTSALLGGGSATSSLGPIAEQLQALPVAGNLVSTALADLPRADTSTASAAGLLTGAISSVTTALNDVPVAGTAIGTVLGSLPGGLSTSTPSSGAADAGSGTGALSSVPVVGTVVSGVVDTTTTTLTTVTQAVAPAPVVGPVVSGVVGSLLGSH